MPVDNYWRENIIDFSKQAAFHVQVDRTGASGPVFYCQSGDGVYPTRPCAIACRRKTWWEEQYPHAVPAGVLVNRNGRPVSLYANASGEFVQPTPAALDAGDTAINYQYRTGNFTLTDSPTRQIGLLYTPTSATADLEVRLHYNGSTASRPNAVLANRGDGVTQTASGAVD